MSDMSTPTRRDAIRTALIAHVTARASRPNFAWIAGLVAAGAIVGAGVSAGAFAATDAWRVAADDDSTGTGIVIEQPLGQPTPALPDPVIAPPGVLPGAPVIILVGDPTSLSATVPTQVPLTERPAAATHLRVSVTCITPGTIRWGTNPSGNNHNPGSSCTAADAGTVADTAWMDLPLDATVSTLFVTPEAGVTASVTLQYVTHVPTLFAVNDRGETYGTGMSDHGSPDLTVVEITGTDGAPILGYVRTAEMDRSFLYGPDHVDANPSTTEEALEWTAEYNGKYPNGWDIPVYESDGTTQIGVLHIGR